MGLIAGVLEGEGISTVCISTFDPIMEQVAPPRWLTIPFPLGFPLGRPGDGEMQRRIIRTALHLLEADGPGPVQRTLDADE